MIIRSPWPSIADRPRLPMWEFLAASARRLPHKVALIQGRDATCTYDELWQAVQAAAHFLQTHDQVVKGEVVAVTAEGSREFLAAMYGAFLAGAAVTPLNPQLRQVELRAQLVDAGAAVVMASFPAEADVELLRRSGVLPDLRRVHPLGQLWGVVHRTRGSPRPVAIDVEQDVALVPYSSGTEGTPTGALMTHASGSAVVYQRLATWDCTEHSIILDLGPKWSAIRGILAAGATVVEPTGSGADGWLDLIERHRVTHIVARPFAVEQLIRAWERHPRDISSVQFVETGGTVLPPQVASRAADLFGRTVGQSFRLNGGGTANRTPPTDIRPGSVGPPVPDTEERIVDPDSGQDVAPGETGELLIRGPQLLKGYMGNPEATERAFLPGGWFRTGDAARADADGHVYIVDRLKDLMKVYGAAPRPGSARPHRCPVWGKGGRRNGRSTDTPA
jgi:acyl-CoA synthetase (AMP-forming)/AMP-acid ligase II